MADGEHLDGLPARPEAPSPIIDAATLEFLQRTIQHNQRFTLELPSARPPLEDEAGD